MKSFTSSARLKLALAAGVAVFAIPVTSAGAAVVSTSSAGTGAPPTTLGGFTLTPFASNPANDGATVTSDPSPIEGVLGFQPADGTVGLQQFEVSDGVDWDSATNTYQGDVFDNQDGTNPTTTLTLPADTQAFYLYAEPSDLGSYSIEATSDSGATSTETVNPFSGAEFYGFYGTKGSYIKSVTVSNPDGQAGGLLVGEFGIAQAPHIVATVSGPSHSDSQVIDASSLESVYKVPASSVNTVLNNLAYAAKNIPADWNLKASISSGLGSSYDKLSSYPKPTQNAPYVACEMNTTTKPKDGNFDFNETFLDALGEPQSAWPATIQALGSVLTSVPASDGISCVEEDWHNKY